MNVLLLSACELYYIQMKYSRKAITVKERGRRQHTILEITHVQEEDSPLRLLRV